METDLNILRRLAREATDVDVAAALCRAVDRLATPPDAVTLRDAAQAVLDWYDRDGSVGGAVEPIEGLRAALSGKGE